MAALGVANETSVTTAPDTIRVMVVDDSAVIRGVLARWLEDDPAIRVTATAANGVGALRQVKAQTFDVVILDIEMPEMDGMTALPQLLVAQPGMQVLMASTLTARNADISLKALSLGAADYIPKPTSTRIVTSGVDFRRELVEKVKAIAQVARRKRGETPVSSPAAPAPRPVVGVRSATPPPLPARAPVSGGAIVHPRPSQARPAVLTIGSSTGGPQALFNVLGALARPFPLPILITQHMPPTFTAILAQHVERMTKHPAAEGQHDEVVRPGRVYIAPGDRHMTVRQVGAEVRIVLDDTPPQNFCRPAVDPLFRSVADVYGDKALAVVLTGMGHDGEQGAGAIIGRGGTVIAQDEATSVVWGMPGAVTRAGFASFVFPLNNIGGSITNLMEGRQP